LSNRHELRRFAKMTFSMPQMTIETLEAAVIPNTPKYGQSAILKKMLVTMLIVLLSIGIRES